MPRKQKSIHYLYKITCNVTGRYYIGMHSTTNLEDGYMGSGKRLRYSLRKHGKENHVKEILEFFESRELLVEAEKKAITGDMLIDAMCMNLKSGGVGGWTSEQQRLNALKSNKKQNELRKSEEWVNKKSKLTSESLKKIYVSGFRERKQPMDWTNKKHSKETILKMKKPKNGGNSNPQYGTQWITNGSENKKTKKDADVPIGWYKGRK